MRANPLLLTASSILFALMPSLSSAATIDMFTCHGGELAVVRSTEAPQTATMLVRTGNALWSDRSVDQATIEAMAEGLGVWAFLSPETIFQVLGTKTAPVYMAGIAIQESGRNNKFWPWTINHQGQSFYYPTKAKAVAAANSLLRQGHLSFDVGMMQVNWKYNGSRFASIQAAFDPSVNIQAADAIVQEHLAQTNSIVEALGRYHSKTPSKKVRYQKMVGQKLQWISQTLPETIKRTRIC